MDHTIQIPGLKRTTDCCIVITETMPLLMTVELYLNLFMIFGHDYFVLEANIITMDVNSTSLNKTGLFYNL